MDLYLIDMTEGMFSLFLVKGLGEFSRLGDDLFSLYILDGNRFSDIVNLITSMDVPNDPDLKVAMLNSCLSRHLPDQCSSYVIGMRSDVKDTLQSRLKILSNIEMISNKFVDSILSLPPHDESYPKQSHDVSIDLYLARRSVDICDLYVFKGLGLLSTLDDNVFAIKIHDEKRFCAEMCKLIASVDYDIDSEVAVLEIVFGRRLPGRHCSYVFGMRRDDKEIWSRLKILRNCTVVSNEFVDGLFRIPLEYIDPVVKDHNMSLANIEAMIEDLKIDKSIERKRKAQEKSLSLSESLIEKLQVVEKVTILSMGYWEIFQKLWMWYKVKDPSKTVELILSGRLSDSEKDDIEYGIGELEWQNDIKVTWKDVSPPERISYGSYLESKMNP